MGHIENQAYRSYQRKPKLQIKSKRLLHSGNNTTDDQSPSAVRKIILQANSDYHPISTDRQLSDNHMVEEWVDGIRASWM